MLSTHRHHQPHPPTLPAFQKEFDCFSSLNKINQFCLIGMRLLAVEAELKLRCLAVLNA